MQAAILAVGSELLGTERLDTNSLLLTGILRRFGVGLARKAVVGDSVAAIRAEVEASLERCELVLVTGGLGPTADDVTREAVAAAVGRGLAERPDLVEDIREKFARFGMRMPEVNRRQAQVIDGAEVLANRRGTAPGLRIERGDRTIFLFPGVPLELEGLAREALEPWLAGRSGGDRVESRYLKVACVPESTLEEMLAPVYGEFGGAGDFSVLSSPGEIVVAVTRAGPETARRAALEARVARLCEALGDAVFAHAERATLEATVGDLLRRAGATVATAESCTGGLLSERLTRVPGSSDYFRGGVVAYSNELKRRLLAVPEALLERHGAVSEEVARAMAAGAREALGSDWAVAVTGIAGPAGGSDEKPVGTVHVALAGPEPEGLGHRRLRLPGDRERVRRLACQWALDLLRRRLLARGAGGAAEG